MIQKKKPAAKENPSTEPHNISDAAAIEEARKKIEEAIERLSKEKEEKQSASEIEETNTSLTTATQSQMLNANNSTQTKPIPKRKPQQTKLKPYQRNLKPYQRVFYDLLEEAARVRANIEQAKAIQIFLAKKLERISRTNEEKANAQNQNLGLVQMELHPNSNNPNTNQMAVAQLPKRYTQNGSRGDEKPRATRRKPNNPKHYITQRGNKRTPSKRT